MFTGIVQAIGQIEEVLPQPSSAGQKGGLRLMVAWGGLDSEDVSEGDSIAINGACMTALRPDAFGFAVDISRESLDCTVGLDRPGPVNLEKAMRASDRLGGHIVSGHIDAVGRVIRLESRGESVGLAVMLPPELAVYVSEKGSIALQGVSLTINQVLDRDDGVEIDINLIPHTWSQTTLRGLAVGDGVNVEVDTIARQVVRCWERMGQLSGQLSRPRGDQANGPVGGSGGRRS